MCENKNLIFIWIKLSGMYGAGRVSLNRSWSSDKAFIADIVFRNSAVNSLSQNEWVSVNKSDSMTIYLEE